MVRRHLRPRAAGRREAKPSKLDPFRPLIRHLVNEQGLSAVRVLEEISAVGYDGRYSILRDWIRTFRLRPTRRPHLRFETEPGEQAQVDLSSYTLEMDAGVTPVVCFSMVFGYSRWNFIHFFRHADVHNVCLGHVLAFEEAGGVPQEILYDRMKQVVLESHRDGVIFHPLFERMAHHYGFRAIPLEPGYKEGKGKVENPFRYIENNFLAGRYFRDMDDLNRKAHIWLEQTARVRIHRTTQERPRDRLDEEQPLLIRLPHKRFQAQRVEPRLVGADFCVAWGTNRYSVPPQYAGRHDAMVHVGDGRIEIHIDQRCVASHPLSEGRHQRCVLDEHQTAFYSRTNRRVVLQARFECLGSAAKAFAEGLREQRKGAAGYHMKRILDLSERVGVAPVAKAIERALAYGAFDAESIQRIVKAKSAACAAPVAQTSSQAPKQLEAYLRGAATHQRDPASYGKTAKKQKKSKPSEEDNHGE